MIRKTFSQTRYSYGLFSPKPLGYLHTYTHTIKLKGINRERQYRTFKDINSRDLSPAPSLYQLCDTGQITRSSSLSFPMCEMGMIALMFPSMDAVPEAQWPTNGKLSINSFLYHVILTHLSSRTSWCLLRNNTIRQNHMHIWPELASCLPCHLEVTVCMFCL